MAVVGPLRAILVARGQELLNQLQREAGGVGLAGAAVVAILVPLALAAPTAGAYIAGLRLGALIAHPAGGAGAAVTLSGMLLLIPLSLGFLAGVLGSDGEGGLSVRGYPVSRRTRLAAQLLSSSVELPPMLALSGLAGLAAGLCVALPAAAPVSLLLCAQAAAWVLIIQRLTRRLRAVGLAQPVFALSALAVMGLLILAGLSRPLFLATGRFFREGLSYSPTTFGAQGLVDLASGDMATSWLRQLLPLALTALAIMVMVRGSEGAEEEARGHRGGNVQPERLWSFDTHSHGIAKLFVNAVTHSRHGLIGVFLPPFLAAMVVAVSAAVAEDPAHAPPPAFLAKRMPDSIDAVPLFGILPFLLVHLNSELWLNQWGWDGRAVRTLFVAPIAVRDLLLGKLMGLATIVGAQYLMTVPLLSLLRLPRAAELLWGLGAGAFALIAMGGLGHVLSAGLSRPVDQRGKINRTESFAAMIAGALVLGGTVTPVLLTFAITRPLGEWGQALGLWALAAIGFAGYRRALPFLSQRVRDMREQFLEAT